MILLTVCSDLEADGRLDFAALPFGESNLTAEQTSAFRAVAHWLKSLEGYENLKNDYNIAGPESTSARSFSWSTHILAKDSQRAAPREPVSGGYGGYSLSPWR
jgi:hypothetical protein